jgi:hypothetical protein
MRSSVKSSSDHTQHITNSILVPSHKIESNECLPGFPDKQQGNLLLGRLFRCMARGCAVVIPKIWQDVLRVLISRHLLPYLIFICVLL